MTFIFLLNRAFGQLLTEMNNLCSNLCHLGKWNHLMAPHSQVWWAMLPGGWDPTWCCWPEGPLVTCNSVSGSKSEHPERKSSQSFKDLLGPIFQHLCSVISISSCSLRWTRRPAQFPRKEIRLLTRSRKVLETHIGLETFLWPFLKNAMCHMGWINQYLH